ncbi:MAG TPA: type II secretion system protein GspG [Phycisphaerales bacterium]|jgi:general secretion pathway protein G|nr:type II secretion system protein GspG [Phycisphaerales bacterium]
MLALLNPRKRSKGFTLLEMMLVVVIIGVLMSVAVYSFAGRSDQAKKAASMLSMKTIGSSVKQYYGEKSVYPSRLEDLVPNYIEKVYVDGWKRPFVYAVTPGGTHPFTLYSTGPSGETGNADNIDYWEDDTTTTTSTTR